MAGWNSKSVSSGPRPEDRWRSKSEIAPSTISADATVSSGGSRQPGTSHRLADGKLTFPHRLGRIAESLSDIFGLQLWDISQDLVNGHPIGDHRHDGCHRDAHAADAGLTAHLVGFNGDAWESHADVDIIGYGETHP